MGRITLDKVTKSFGDVEVIPPLDLTIEDGEFTVFVGPSGCGKSTLLRLIAGLEDISGGEVSIGGRVVNDLPPRERNISMVFQNYALYPHMTVRENLGFSLHIAKQDPDQIKTAVDDAAAILGLDELMDRKPAELSGGQRQRVAMGRAIVRHPDVFLFDEPLSNLDAKLRTQMRAEIKKLHQRIGNTIIYVTHDQVEAMTLADRIVLMRDGHIVQVGTPLELFNAPVDTFVATFIGSPPMNLVEGVITGGNIQLTDGHILPIPTSARGLVRDGQPIHFGFRADNLMPVGHAVDEASETVPLDLTITLTEPLGTETLLFTHFGGAEVQAKMFNPRPVAPGEQMTFQLVLDKCHVFDANSGLALRS